MENFCSDSQAVTHRSKTFGKVAAVLIAVLGLYIIIFIIRAVWQIPFSEDPLLHIPFLLAFPIPVVIFGGYCLFVAYSVWSNLSVKTVQGVSLIAAIMLSLIILGKLYPIIEDSWKPLMPPVLIVVSGLFYVWCNKLLIKWLGLKEVADWSHHEKSVRCFLRWMAFFTWVACSNITMNLLPKNPKYTHVPKEPWGIIVFLGSAILVYLVYKLSIQIILRRKPVEMNK